MAEGNFAAALAERQQQEASNDDFLKQMKELFPAVSEEWVVSQLQRGYPQMTIMNIVSSPTTAHLVPRKQKTRVPSDRSVDSPVEAYADDKRQISLRKRQLQRYFQSVGEERQTELRKRGVLDSYMRTVIDSLANAFRGLSIVGIRQIAASCGHFYAPSWKCIWEAENRNIIVQKRDGKYLEVQTPTGRNCDVKILKCKRAQRRIRSVPHELKEEIALTEEYSSGENRGMEDAGGEEGVFECGICFNEVDASEQICCGNQHAFCSECVSGHAKEAAYGQGMSAQLSCLEQDCEAGFKRGDLKYVLDRDIYRRLDQRLAEENLHKARIQNLEREEKLTLTVIRKCHDCGLAFEKVTGCNKMTCRCKATLCYICREPNIGYDHFCNHPKDPGDTACQHCNKCFLWEDPKNRDMEALEKVVDEAKDTGIKEELLDAMRPTEKKPEAGAAVAENQNPVGGQAAFQLHRFPPPGPRHPGQQHIPRPQPRPHVDDRPPQQAGNQQGHVGAGIGMNIPYVQRHPLPHGEDPRAANPPLPRFMAVFPHWRQFFVHRQVGNEEGQMRAGVGMNNVPPPPRQAYRAPNQPPDFGRRNY